jgi:hypothetical protein
MAAEYNLIQFNSHKNISIKETKKKEDQIRTQDVTKFGLQCLRLRDPQPLTIEIQPKH